MDAIMVHDEDIDSNGCKLGMYHTITREALHVHVLSTCNMCIMVAWVPFLKDS